MKRTLLILSLLLLTGSIYASSPYKPMTMKPITQDERTKIILERISSFVHAGGGQGNVGYRIVDPQKLAAFLAEITE